MRKALFALALVTFAVVGFAQGMDQSPPQQVKDLGWMVGKWTGTMDMDMDGQKTHMTVDVDIAFEFKFLKMTSVMDMQVVKMNEISYVFWDAKASKYAIHTYTDFADTPRIESGDMKDGALVTESLPWVVGGMPEPTVGRSTMKKVTDSEISTMLEFKQGDKWVVVATGTMKKKS